LPLNTLRRSGPLEVKLALEIATQVAAGLAAVHKQELVHRDIKPSNIMVSVDEASGVVAKIIDLGLAKTTSEAGSQITISASGGFAGTPEFASPEQFGGVDVDIRSDLYSLGVSLWQMLTDAWANQDVDIVTIVAWAGVGKSTLVNPFQRPAGVWLVKYRSSGRRVDCTPARFDPSFPERRMYDCR